MSVSTSAEPGISVRARNETSELISLSSEWSELCTICQEATPFQSPEWLLAWVESFRPTELMVVEVRDRGSLIGIAPLLIYPRDSERVLAFAGGGISDYLGLLYSPGRELDVVRAMLACVRESADWSLLELTDICANSALLNIEPFRDYIAEHDSCSVLHLRASVDELLQTLSKRQRANLRNARSRLQRAGVWQFELATPDTLPEFLDDLFRLHTARWSQSGESGVLHDECTRAFHRACAPPLLANGVLKLYRLRLQNRTIAVVYSLWDRDAVYCYLQGFNPEFSFVSPGTLLMFHVIEQAVEHGICRFDFLRGTESYKQHWRAQRQATYRVRVSKADLA